MARFHLTLIRPPGFVHSSCFHEVIQALYAGLSGLGYWVTGSENSVEPGATNIVLGAHLLEEEVAMGLPASTVIYNLEQLGAAWLPPWYLALAARFAVWDYAAANLAVWRAVPCVRPPQLVEVAYMPVLSRIAPAPVQDIDILFYGSMTERRREVLMQIEAAGLGLQYGFGLYGAERDAVIARSKLVLNLHAHAMELFEIVRVSYLLANSKAVVSERSADIGYLGHAVAEADRGDLVRTCRELLEDDAKRRRLEQRGFALFSANSLLHSLSRAARRPEPPAYLAGPPMV